MIPSKGTTFHYTFDATHTAEPEAALPTTYPLAGADLTMWPVFTCVQEVSGIDAIMAETVKHRCLDSNRPLEEDFPTGFFTSEPVAMTVTYAPALEALFRAAKLARTKLRILIVFPLDETQTTSPDRFAYKVRCTKCEPIVDSGGNPIDIQFEFVLYDDTGVYTQGS